MNNRFKVTGFFYQINRYKFRKYLNIKKHNSKREIPDLMVIMMNPGSSRPLHGSDKYCVEIEAVPDNTQNQIMRVMSNCNFEYARILNLSDLREPKSSVFYKKIDEIEKYKIAHSIFDDKRNSDFENLFVKNIPVIFAWGVNKKLKELATLAMNKIGIEKYIGLKKEGVDFAFYHPLPPNYNKQKEWVEKITEMIIARNKKYR